MEKVNKNKRKIDSKNKKKNKKKSKIWSKILIFLLLVLVALVVGVIYKTKQNGGGMQGLLTTIVGHDEETLKKLDPIQVLLMGMSTDNGAKLTDTIIVATYNPKNQTASLLSIPRDTFVGKNPTAGTGYDKINSVYQNKGAEGVLEKVNNLTGLEIPYYMLIDNQALIELVDVIGGVEFNVPIDMNYDDTSQNLHIHLKAGLQKIDGDKAEQLLRFRKNNNGTTYPESYGGNDYGRMRTQREFMIETAKQTLQAKNILKIKDIIDIVYEYVDTNLSIEIIKDYVPYAINIDINTIQSVVIPGASYGPPKYPLWFFIANDKETKDLIKQLYYTEKVTNDDELLDGESSKESTTTQNTSTNETISTQVSKDDASDIEIEILNGSGLVDVATEVQKKLKNLGYNVQKPKTTTNTSKTTIINKTDVDETFTNNIKEAIGVGTVSTSSVSSSKVDITIIIGKDYNKE